MSERLILVCDKCGQPAVETITLRVKGRNLNLDLCHVHLEDVTAGAHAPRRGRRAAAALVDASSAKRRGRPPGSKNRAVSGNGRRRRTAQSSSAG